MAIAPTGAIYKALVFDGENSRNYGVYITGEAVYNAPERDVEMVSIPGRNGSFALDKGRFENIEVTYPAGIFADTETDFAEAISDFRNFLCSRKGYVRLTDEYNPDEYRMAIYKSGLEVSPAQLKAGEFNITFDCKPQRFLTSGEDPITIGEWGDTETASGTIASFEAVEGDGVKSLVVDIEPYQSGSGTPSPDNVRPISGYGSVVVTVADDNDSPTVSNTYTTSLSGTRYGGTLDVVSGVLTVDRTIASNITWTKRSSYAHIFYAQTGMGQKNGGNVISNELVFADLGLASFASETEYRVKAGDRIYVNIPAATTESELTTWLESNPLQIVYELDTPTTVQLTAQEVELLVGLNQIWANSGDVSVEYGTAPNVVINPTLFEARPMLEVVGYGDIHLNADTISLANMPMGTIPISAPATGTNSVTVTFDVSNLVSGDAIKSTQNIRARAGIEMSLGYTIKSINTSVPGYDEGYVESQTSTSAVLVSECPFNNIVYGQYVYGTWTTGFEIEENDGSKSYIYFDIHVEYDEDLNTLAVTLTTNSYVAEIQTVDPRLYIPAYYGNSTKNTSGNPAYIDLEIGEAWNEDTGTPVSINNAVTMPAELPTMTPGANTISFDNTITTLRVVPRWWKV